MKIQIICIGKLKEKYWSEASAEYMKRLSKYCDPQITELRESKLPDKASAADEETVIDEEGKNILKHIKEGIGSFFRLSRPSQGLSSPLLSGGARVEVQPRRAFKIKQRFEMFP